MNILITNDDGVKADGINILKKELCKIAQVYIVAPLEERSASGHSITLHDVLRVKKIEERIYGCSGYPADCVVLGVNYLFKKIKFDLILSGINKGANMAQDIFYSGTVAGAREGLIFKIPSVAISLAVNDEQFYFDEQSGGIRYGTAARFLRKFIEKNGVLEIRSDALLNINVPNVSYKDLCGVKYTIPGFIDYPRQIEKRRDTRGRDYYWRGGKKKAKIFEIPHSDCLALRENFISITELKLSYFLADEFEQRSKVFKKIFR